jgi:mono/diheme cytochrome c family protein
MKLSVVGIAIGAIGMFLFASILTVAQDQTSESPAEKALINSLNGQALYQTYCATCHGDDARGNGPMATVLKTPPPDLTEIATRNGGMFSSKNVEKIISGQSELTAHGSREMPLWGPIFSQVAWDQDLGRVRIANLVKYLESIQRPPRIGEIKPR